MLGEPLTFVGVAMETGPNEGDGDLTEDQLKKAHDLIDKALKACESQLSDALKSKSKEILED